MLSLNKSKISLAKNYFLVSPIFLLGFLNLGLADEHSPLPDSFYEFSQDYSHRVNKVADKEAKEVFFKGKPQIPYESTRKALFSHHKISINSQLFIKEKKKNFSFFVFSKVVPLMLAFDLNDHKDSLKGLNVSVNGHTPKFILSNNLDNSMIFENGRRGINKITITPITTVTGVKVFKQRYVSWEGNVFLTKAVVISPHVLIRGLGKLTAVEEEIYFFLRRFDSLLRILPHDVFPTKFVHDFQILPSKVQRVFRTIKNDKFIKTMNDFYRIAYGENIKIAGSLDGMTKRMQSIKWLWNEPHRHPLAGYIYSTNSHNIYLQGYMADVVLAKSKVKFHCSVIEQNRDSVDVKVLLALVKSLKAEIEAFSNLVEVSSIARIACLRRAKEIYSKFPNWKKIFPKAFSARVRARFWNGGMYPQKDDLFCEEVLLSEYFRLVKSLGREGLGQARLRYHIVKALVSFSQRPVAIPVVHPFNPQDSR